MKDVFKFILFLAAVYLIACAPIDSANTPSPEDHVSYKGSSPGVYNDVVTKFEFEGHKYIRFGEYRSQTIVHDPDCECHQKYIPATETEYEYTY